MLRELAVLGVSIMLVLLAELLDVDRHLIEAGIIAHDPSLIAAQAVDQLDEHERRGPTRQLPLLTERTVNAAYRDHRGGQDGVVPSLDHQYPPERARGRTVRRDRVLAR